MKKIYQVLFNNLFLLFLLSLSCFAFGQEFPQLKIVNQPNVITLDPGQTLQVQAEYYDQDGSLQNVSVKWHTEPGYLGRIDKKENLLANHPGEGFLFAKFRDLLDSIPLVITGPQKGDDLEEDEYPKVKIVPGSVKIESADSVELRAFYINELGEKVDTFFQWSVSDPDLGTFPHDTASMFFAGNPGHGFISASLGELADTIRLTVIEPKVRHEYENNKRVVILPGDTTVHLQPGTTIQYTAVIKNSNSDNTQIKWSVTNESIATIDAETGLLTLGDQTGITLVKATFGKITAFAELLVVDPNIDLTVNTITVHCVLPDGTELPPKKFREGESYKIGGLPYPLNILNAGMLHFPFGCIHEDITLYMFIPEEYAQTDDENSEVSFTEQIITGVKFSVLPAGSDEIVEPYPFDIPVVLSLVFKQGLLDSLQVNPEDLDVFFADNTGFVTTADDKVEIDTIRNKIYARIEHFSTIVVKQKSSTTSSENREGLQEKTLKVYPNPFHSSTKILFNVTDMANVNLTIYNIFGKRIRTLVDEVKPRGNYSVTWNGKSDDGTQVTSGFYVCRILIDGKEAQATRMILNR